MDKDNHQYGPLNGNNQPVRRKNAEAGSFRTNVEGRKNDVFSSSPGGGRTIQSPQSASEKKSGAFSVNIPEQPRRPQQPQRVSQSAQRTQQPRPHAQKTEPAGQRPASAQRSSAQAGKSAAGANRAQPPKKPVNRAQSKPAASAASGRTRLTPEEKRFRKEKKRRARLRSLLGFIVCAIFIALITVSLSVVAISAINDILCIGKDSGVTVSVVVEKGDDFNAVFDKLCDNGLIAQKQISKLFCLYRHYDTVDYEPGAYYFDTNDGVEAMLEEMKVSKGASSFVVRLTFPEGWSIAKIFQKIEKNEVCTAEKLYANLDIVGEQYDFYKKITSKSGRYLMAEGYLFPDTYEFFKNESASSVLRKLFDNFEEHWTKEFSARAKELGLSRDQVITIASIIQREAANKAQMKDISSVIHNRLNSVQYTMLQCDSTADYIYNLNTAFKIFDDVEYSRYYEAYNTYSIQGLPPGPICNPGLDAIDAALNPNSTPYYFFAHDSLGQIYLAVTDYEHQANLAKIFEESN